MSTVELSFETAKASMDEIRADLDAALQKEFPGGMLKRSWDGDTLQLTGPGAKGTILLEGGQLIGRAELKPPASMMRAVIEQKIGDAMKAAVG